MLVEHRPISRGERTEHVRAQLLARRCAKDSARHRYRQESRSWPVTTTRPRASSGLAQHGREAYSPAGMHCGLRDP